ncbi:MAG: M28 family peptidase [Ignavibacterium sp.]|nr:M28 family peptidase [Ignavibacterium sp.]MDW8375356.1 M28 family peptidase [Ignavibacteriales bacterium]
MKNSYIKNLTILLLIFSSLAFAQNSIVQQIINSVNQDSLVYFARELSGNVQTVVNGQNVTIVSRHKNNPANELAKDYIRQKLQQYGLNVTIQNFSSTGNNVLGIKVGTQYPNRKYIICAHYDDMPSGSVAPGADDNASGTAAVIEAARVLSQYSFPYTLIFALWDEEEQGLVGATYYATQARNANDSILGVINMDMIAYDSNNDNKAEIHNRAVANSVEIYQKMVEVNSTYGIGINIVNKNPGITASDHAAFWNRNYGAILLIEDNTSDFNAYYHTVNDLVQYYNIPYFVKMSKLAIGTFATLALNLNMLIEHQQIASTNISAPITTTAQIVTNLMIGTGINSPRLYYRTKTGSGNFSAFQQVVGVNISSNNYSFTIPQQPLGTIVQYYIAAQDVNSQMVVTLPQGGSGYNPPGNVPPSTLFQFFVAEKTIILNDNASNLSNWTSSGQWGITTTKFVSSPSSFTDSPSGYYANSTTATLTLNNNIALTGALGAELEFSTQWDIENNWDYGQVLISTNNGSTWIPLAGQYTNAGTGSFQPNGEPLYDGTQLTWVNERMDISQYVGNNIKLRFLLRSDGAVNADGWYVDDIKISIYSSLVPVELTSFTASANNNNVVLNWSTATELNNKGFEIERASLRNSLESSQTLKNWEKIGFVEGNGTTSEIKEYSFTDKNLNIGTHYYRLKQIDFDGSFVYSQEIKVDLTSPINYNLSQNYPNPFNPNTMIKFQIPVDAFVSIKVFDVLGNEVKTLVNEFKQAGFYEIEFDGSELSSGIYFYKLKTENFNDVKKMILIK